jgi:hypothetical protein
VTGVVIVAKISLTSRSNLSSIFFFQQKSLWYILEGPFLRAYRNGTLEFPKRVYRRFESQMVVCRSSAGGRNSEVIQKFRQDKSSEKSREESSDS